MLYSYNWLKEYIDKLPAPALLAELLTMTGSEVDSVRDLSRGIDGVVTARIEKVAPHPNADKLKLCLVSDGKKTYSIVCGASNMKDGDYVALARPGAALPGGIKIKRVKLRGVESGGMLCSEAELGLKESSEGIMILPQETPLGRDIRDALGLRDFILEVSITPNRADLLSIRGLAREIAAVTGSKFSDKKVKVKEKGREVKGIVKVGIKPGTPCGRYAARVIEGVKIGPSPAYMRRRLEAHGLRPVNNVVDVTNYVLLEAGQPLHAFDLDKIKDGKITVRGSKGAEGIETIDNKERKLAKGMVVIADSTGPLAVGGIMGGRATEVTGDTQNILLESAWFEPTAVRRASRGLGLASDSSYRFERGTDIENVRAALDMAAGLIAECSGGVVAKGAIDIYPEKYKPGRIKFNIKRAGAVLGVPLKKGAVKDIFKRLGVSASGVGDELVCRPPSFRMDIKEEIDLVEEAARIFGYDNIPTVLPEAELKVGGLPFRATLKRRIREALSAAGFLEVMNYSFVSEDASSLFGADEEGIRLLNPLSEDHVVMRESLLHSLLMNLSRNINMKNTGIRIFEVAPVFSPDKKLPQKLPEERWKTSGLIYGTRWKESWNFSSEPVDFYDIKGAVERLLDVVGRPGALGVGDIEDGYKCLFHPGKSASITLDGRLAGAMGEVHPDVMSRFGLKAPAYLFELDLDSLAEVMALKKKFTPLPRYPASERDLAFILDSGITYGEIISAVKKIDTKLVEKVNLFDVYYGGNVPDGKRSLALRVVYRSREGTLVQEDVEKIHSRVAAELVSRFGAVIRGKEGATE